jgi:hypothetical protein
MPNSCRRQKIAPSNVVSREIKIIHEKVAKRVVQKNIP